MMLCILTPSNVVLSLEVTKVVAEAWNGSFGLLPHHVEYVTALVPGILSCITTDGREIFVATDEGTLVKYGDTVFVSTVSAVVGPELAMLKETVAEQFVQRDEHDRAARAAIARLEASMVRRFIEISSGITRSTA